MRIARKANLTSHSPQNQAEPKNCRNVNEKSKKIGKIFASTKAKGQKERREREGVRGSGSTHNGNAGQGGVSVATTNVAK